MIVGAGAYVGNDDGVCGLFCETAQIKKSPTAARIPTTVPVFSPDGLKAGELGAIVPVFGVVEVFFSVSVFGEPGCAFAPMPNWERSTSMPGRVLAPSVGPSGSLTCGRSGI